MSVMLGVPCGGGSHMWDNETLRFMEGTDTAVVSIQQPATHCQSMHVTPISAHCQSMHVTPIHAPP